MSLKDWLIDYSQDVITGKITACQKHKWACQRFLKDVNREGSKKFPYVFNEEKALRFLNWMTLFKHTKGPLAGERIIPSDIQMFNFGNIYGWVHQDTGYRRFKKAYWQVGRKNAKSQSLACVGSYEASAMGESMSEVYIGATKTKQSKIVWEEIEAQLRGSEELKGKFQVAYGEIKHIKSSSVIAALSKEAGKTGDGFNPQCGIIDEYHAHTTSEIYDVLDSGMGARPQPLMMIITTAGNNINNPCYRVEYKYVSRILDPHDPTVNEEYFVMINELEKDDDIKDERNWPKANPILCSHEVGRNYLRGQLKAALAVPEKMRTFMTKNMNVWLDAKENGYIPLDRWAACGTEQPPDVTGRECYIGFDLSATLDLTSVAWEFPLEDGRFFVDSHSFIPEERMQEKMNTDNVDYAQWARDGWITVIPGAVIDYNFVREHIFNTIKDKDLIPKEVCYDKWNANQLVQELAAEGLLCVEIPQGIKHMTSPTKNFRELVYQKKILHRNNPVLTWAIGNAVTKVDSQENIMLDKAKSTERIDPIASLINAHKRAMNLIDHEVDVSEFTDSDFLTKLWG